MSHRAHFRDVLHTGLGMTDAYMMERVMVALDRGTSPYVTMQTFAKAMSLYLRGTLEERITYAFTVSCLLWLRMASIIGNSLISTCLLSANARCSTSTDSHCKVTCCTAVRSSYAVNCPKSFKFKCSNASNHCFTAHYLMLCWWYKNDSTNTSVFAINIVIRSS